MWGASVASVGVLSPFVSLFFVELWLLLVFQSDLGGEKFLWHAFIPSSHFNGRHYQYLHPTERQETELWCLSPNSETHKRFFFFLSTSFDSLSYKVKGRLALVLSCFRLLKLHFSVPDVLKIMCRDLTPIFSWLWNPGRLNYEHDSTAFFLRLPEKCLPLWPLV